MRRTRKIMVLAIATLCGLIFSPMSVEGALITIEIEAVVDSVWDDGDYLEGKIKPGDMIRGSYTYDSSITDTNPSLSVGDYWHYSPPYGILLAVSGFEFKTDPANVNFFVEILNDHPWFDPHINKDNYVVGSNSNLLLSNGTLVDSIVWQLDDPTGNALSSTDLPTAAPVLDDWQTIVGLRMHGERGGYIIDATVTSAIPEPASVLLLALGGFLLRKRR